MQAYALGFDSELGRGPDHGESDDQCSIRNVDGETRLQGPRWEATVHYPCGRVLRMAEGGKRKIPIWVHLKNREPFGLAGL